MTDKVTYLHLADGQPVPPLRQGPPFKAAVIIEQDCGKEWRAALCKWIVHSGCLSASTWGTSCEVWHDEIDHVNLSDFDWGDIPGDAFVLTSWHDHGELSEALFFVAECVEHPHVPLEVAIIIHISEEERKAELLAAFEKASQVD